MKKLTKYPWAFFLLGASCLKSILLIFDRFPFNSDEAIVALMARHIVLNGERPIFFYGQAYMGSLDAFLVAFGFALFGFHVWVIRTVQILLYLLVLLSTLKIAEFIFPPSNGKWYTAALLVVPTVNVTLYTTVSLGGYGEALLIGNLILLSGLKINQHLQNDRLPATVWIVGLGFWIGLGWWVNGLTGIYTLPVLISLIWCGFQVRQRFDTKKLMLLFLLLLVGVMVGSILWWIYALQEGMEKLIREVLGSAIAPSQQSWLLLLLGNLFNLSLFGASVTLGLRPPWEIRWLALPLAPFALAFWLAILGLWMRHMRKNKAEMSHWMISGVALSLIGAFVLTPFGTDPSGRYFVPLWIILSLIAGEMVVKTIPKARLQIAAIGLIVAFNLIGTLECALRFPPGLTTQFDAIASIDHRYLPELIQFLKEHQETRGYSNYWVAYPLVFLSEEQILFSPRLPYHPDLRYTPRDDRIPFYTEQVTQSDRIAYITTKNTMLDEYLRDRFRQAGVEWSETWIGDYHVFYRLSRRIHPQEIGLGILYP